MFPKVLVANCEGIAVHIIRTCRGLGVQTAAVYSEADQEALRVQSADEATCTEPVRTTDSYLNVQAVLSTAVITNAEAIHPGSGFLSENSQFASICEECNITSIGPRAETIDAMGSKINARQLMQKARVPVVPGNDGVINSVEEALMIAEEIGYPVISKAAAGGGGERTRKVLSKEELLKHFTSAQQEAKAAFGNDDMCLEKIIYPARHIEVQILGNQYEHVIHLGECGCSLQRDNRKVLEEPPLTAISEEEYRMLGETTVRAAQAVHYENTGTVESLMGPADDFYFMGMNTRIQAEHPVMEMVTGTDLVKAQPEIAPGEPLGYTQEDIILTGYTIECRVNAESPASNFALSPDKTQSLLLPSGGIGLRVDSAMYSGYSIPSYYDSVIVKVIVHDKSCFNALMKMQRALNKIVAEGIITNAEFQLGLITHDDVSTGNYDTSSLQETFLPNWGSEDSH